MPLSFSSQQVILMKRVFKLHAVVFSSLRFKWPFLFKVLWQKWGEGDGPGQWMGDPLMIIYFSRRVKGFIFGGGGVGVNSEVRALLLCSRATHNWLPKSITDSETSYCQSTGRLTKWHRMNILWIFINQDRFRLTDIPWELIVYLENVVKSIARVKTLFTPSLKSALNELISSLRWLIKCLEHCLVSLWYAFQCRSFLATSLARKQGPSCSITYELSQWMHCWRMRSC